MNFDLLGIVELLLPSWLVDLTEADLMVIKSVCAWQVGCIPASIWQPPEASIRVPLADDVYAACLKHGPILLNLSLGSRS